MTESVGASSVSRSTGRRASGYAVTAGWVVLLLVGVGYGVMLALLGSANCEPVPGSSTYGEFGWSAVPPGPTCTFVTDVHGFDEVRGPTPVMSLWLVLLVVIGGLAVHLLRRARTD